MRVCRIQIHRFRGVKTATILLPQHGVLVGDNNCGKTTILEALDLVLGPDRLNKRPPINEHDFYRSEYRSDAVKRPVTSAEDHPDADGLEAGPADLIPSKGVEPQIEITVTATDLSREQTARFGPFLEFWNSSTLELYKDADATGVDKNTVTPALRVTFVGHYDPEDDDFSGSTFFTRTQEEDDRPTPFTRHDKRLCGFLYLRSLRTGSRALSLERGSLLDIILRIKEVRPQLWEDTIRALGRHEVAADPALGISPILKTISSALRKYVPADWGMDPHLRVSSLTRDHLRAVITAFIATGSADHSVPFYMQGRGTINVLVLALLSEVAAAKDNVIFAMEEPETAIPPYAQKRIVHEVRQRTGQSIFTSHSPYVVEEFGIEEVVVIERRGDGNAERHRISLPPNLKVKRYQQDFRTRFAEGLLAPRILLAEGATEAAAFPAVCRRLEELDPSTYVSLEALGICSLNAGGETELPSLGDFYGALGKSVFAVCDRQSDEKKKRLERSVEILLMHDEKGFEALVLNNTSDNACERFVRGLDLPPHLSSKYTRVDGNERAILQDYFVWSKGMHGIADFLCQCEESEIPTWIRDACVRLRSACTPQEGASNDAAAPLTEEMVTNNDNGGID